MNNKLGYASLLVKPMLCKYPLILDYQVCGDCLSPCKAFIQSANMGLLPIDLKALRLLDVQFFLNYPIEEHYLPIHLIYSPSHNGD